MKLNFTDLTLKNVLSIGSQPVKVEYKKGLHAITGQVIGQSTSNGSGKSTLGVDGLTFALYGKTVRKLKKQQIVNAVNECDCSAIVRFTVNGHPWRIERGIKPDFLHLIDEKNEDKNDEKSSKKSTQEDINALIGISYDSFINLITLNINYSKTFFRMEKAEKREFLEHIMNLSIYGRMFEKAKKKYLDLKNDTKILEADIQTKIKSYKDKVETYKKIETLKASFETTKQQKISSLQSQLEILEKDISDLKSTITEDEQIKNKSKYQETKYKLIEIQSNIKNKISSTQSDIRQKESRIQSITRNPVCKECGTPTTSEHIQTHISELQTEINDLKSNLPKYESKLVECNDKLKQINERLQKIITIEESVRQTSLSLQKKETQYQNILQSLEDTKKSEFTATNVITRDALISDKKEIEQLKSTYNETRKKFLMCEAMKDILGDKGIKNFTIRKILPHLNQKMNKHLATMKALYTIKFDGELNEILKSRNRDEMTYENFSAGEQKRIDIAWLFTILDISRMRNSIDCNILIMDEILDSSMCANGINQLMEYLKEDFRKDYQNMCTYIITHKSEINFDDFDSIITVKKENGFTKIIDQKNI